MIYHRKRKGRSLHNRGCDQSLIRKYFLMNGNGLISRLFMVDLKGFEPTTLRMRTVRSPKRCSSMHHKPHRKLPTIIRYCRKKAKKVYGLVQFFTVQAKKQASCDNQAIFPYYTPPICEMSTQWRRYSSHRGKGMLKNEDFGRYVRIQKHARQSVLFYYHRR